jgi:uncharacterized OsmC-like protein
MQDTTDRRANGVDIDTLFATINAVRQQPEAARFRFRAVNEWVSGTHSRGRFPGFFGAGQERLHAVPGAGEVVVEADHPAVLVGTDLGPTPAELLLNALAACLVAGLGNVAAARAIDLRAVTCRVEGDVDLRGILGIDPAVRNGFSDIRVVFDIDADEDADAVAALVAQSRARSAVFDVLTHGTAVEVEVARR